MNESCGPAQVTRGLKIEPDQKDQRFDEKKGKNSEGCRPLTAREQLFGSSNYYLNDENSPQLSPVYQSEAAREIILEMSGNPVRRQGNRRQIRKEKRRHHTVSNIRHVTENENQFSKMVRTKCVFRVVCLFVCWHSAFPLLPTFCLLVHHFFLPSFHSVFDFENQSII